MKEKKEKKMERLTNEQTIKKENIINKRQSQAAPSGGRT